MLLEDSVFGSFGQEIQIITTVGGCWETVIPKSASSWQQLLPHKEKDGWKGKTGDGVALPCIDLKGAHENKTSAGRLCNSAGTSSRRHDNRARRDFIVLSFAHGQMLVPALAFLPEMSRMHLITVIIIMIIIISSSFRTGDGAHKCC